MRSDAPVGRDDIISFAGGIPSPDIFPLEELKEIVLELFAKEPRQVFQYSSTEGRNDLKDYIVEFLSRRGIKTSREELIITSGSQQALDLIAKVLVDPGDPVLVENRAMSGDWRPQKLSEPGYRYQYGRRRDKHRPPGRNAQKNRG